MITLLLRVTRRYEARSETCDSLVVFDELVEAEQDAQPACAVVWLQVEADLVYDGRPLAGVVLFDHVVDTCRQLDPGKVQIRAV